MDHITSHRLIGIDGGGTGCRVAVALPGGEVVARSDGGPANFATNPAETIINIRKAIDQAATAAELDQEDLAHSVVHAGIAGVQRSNDANAIAAALPFHRCTVTEDRVTAMSGALGDDDGVLISAGTGTFVGVRQGDTMRFFGGWGLHVSDQASGAWLGRRLLEVVLLVYDGLAEPSDLSREVLRRFGGDPTEIVAFTAQATPASYATLAPSIVEAAEANDVHALELMNEGASYLQRCIVQACARKNMSICLTGGLGEHYKRYFDEVWQGQIQPSKGTALDGALQLARKSLLATERTP